ncbi:hypothetical protein Ahy_B03g064959 [Arachis hypogaea]|uniref:Protein kinase domain-containing protein n=1 Tax=Arachis hypogaea TaxID=3818 RepID=A0A445A0P2_ARAHY|nr:hypothetical protein Ahy_B03g064959 [Arachis hypogaea]
MEKEQQEVKVLTSSKFTWTINNFIPFPRFFYSETFFVGPYSWQIAMIPSVTDIILRGLLVDRLYAVDIVGWRSLNFKLSLVNQLQGKSTITKVFLREPRATTRPCFTVHPPSATVATPAPPLGRHRVAPAIHSSSSIFPFLSPVSIPCFPGFVLFTAAVRNEFVFPLNVALDELVYCAVLVLNSGLGANILVDNKGCIKLADFGASKQVELASIRMDYLNVHKVEQF